MSRYVNRGLNRLIDEEDAAQMQRAFAAGLSTRQACAALGLNRVTWCRWAKRNGWPSCPPPEVWRSRVNSNWRRQEVSP